VAQRDRRRLVTATVPDREWTQAFAVQRLGDDCLLASASSSSAIVVTGDGDLLALSEAFPIYSPSAFLGMLEESGTTY